MEADGRNERLLGAAERLGSRGGCQSQPQWQQRTRARDETTYSERHFSATVWQGVSVLQAGASEEERGARRKGCSAGCKARRGKARQASKASNRLVR